MDWWIKPPLDTRRHAPDSWLNLETVCTSAASEFLQFVARVIVEIYMRTYQGGALCFRSTAAPRFRR